MSRRDWDKVCPMDINHPVMRSERYDKYACLVCDRWLDDRKCEDPNCCFCKDRPEKPSGN
jgi:hypothetical protein